MSFVFLALFLLLASFRIAVAGESEPTDFGASESSAPFLFLTAADVARAREGVRTNPEFARLARELAQRAIALNLLPTAGTIRALGKGRQFRSYRGCRRHHTSGKPPAA